MLRNASRVICRALLSVAALGLFAVSPSYAQNAANMATIVFLAAADHPPMPAGLMLVCMPVSNQGAPNSLTCPVVKYQGISTWAYSYQDNRNALALVSYDSQNNVIRNVQKNGARYLFNAISSEPNKTVTFIGQAEQWVTAPWSELGTATQ